MRALPVALACVVLIAAPAARCGEVDPAVLRAEAQRVAVVSRAMQAAIAIFAAGGQGGGSGVIISPDGYALSNFHVTKGAGDVMKCGLPDGSLYDAVIVGIDPVGDVALLKLFGREDFPHATLGDSDSIRVGDWVFAVGNPFLLATDFQPTVTYGIVSGVHRYQYPAGTLLEYADCIQTDASINPGNSGGPLFDSRGLLVGINGRASFEKRGRVNVGVGYAISINQIQNFLGCLRAGRIVDHATLGARLISQEDGRVIVGDILETSDAYRRGLRYGDEVVRFAGRPIHTVNAFKNALGIYPRGWRVPLVYRRGGETHEVLVRLAGVHSSEELLELVQGRAGKREQDGPPRRREPPAPQPREPGEEPPEEPDPHRPQPGQPQPGDPPLQQGGGPEVPEHIKPYYEPRRGFANYYFNRVEVRRVWGAVRRGDVSSREGTWVAVGTVPGQGDAAFELSAELVRCRLPGGQVSLPLGNDLAGATQPEGSGGLLAALALWRRLLLLGPDEFGDLHYYGAAPLSGLDSLADVLVGTWGGVECWFYFDPTSGDLAALEAYVTAQEDPCELRFARYADFQGRRLPCQIEARYGDQVYGVYELPVWSIEGDGVQ
jgi:S1-C subfamily serine protease